MPRGQHCLMKKAPRCRVGFHRWERAYDNERMIRVKICRLCGLRMSREWPKNVGGIAG